MSAAPVPLPEPLPEPAAPPGISAAQRAGLLTAFFVSGVAGLVYQVAWQRALTWVFGVDLYATTTVVACFLLGLGLGSEACARWGGRIHHPGRAYAVLEVLIAVAGVLSLKAFALVQWIDRLLVAGGQVDVSSPTHLGLRFVLVFLVMVVPTAAMGATLPLLVRASGVGRSTGSGGIGLVYGINTAGAVAGSLATGFWLIRAIGVSGAIAVAAGLNLLAALVAGTFFRRAESIEGSATERVGRMPAGAQRLLAIYGASGFASLGFEVLWVRKYVLLLDHTIYTFSLVLGLYLAGLALGSLVGTRLGDRVADRVTLLAGGFATLGLVVAATSHAYVKMPRWLGLPVVDVPRAGMAIALAMALPTFLLGAIFPLVSRRLIDLGLPPGRAVARTAVSNTLGCVVGTVATGFMLLPVLGTRGTEMLLTSIFALCAVAALAGGGGAPALRAAVMMVALLGTATAATAPSQPLAAVVGYRSIERVVWSREGAHGVATIGLDPARVATLRLNGMSEGNPFSPGNAANLFSHLPALLVPNPGRAFVVGLGSGNTSSAFLAHPGLSVTIAELAPEIRAGARMMLPERGSLFDSPRAAVVEADARQLLALRTGSYDIILSGTRPFVYMGGNLYSQDYWRLCRDRLAQDGLHSQWILGADTEHLRLLLRTFLSVFPEASAWDASGQVCLLGSRAPLRISHRDLARRMADPSIRPALEAIGLRQPLDLYRRFRRNRAELARIAGSGPVSTDDRPLTEFPARRAPLGPNAPVVLEPSRVSDVADLLVDLSEAEREELRAALRTR